MAGDANALCDSTGFVNPTDLAGRSLVDSVDYCMENGISLGGRNLGAIPGDTYSLATIYQYGKENLWAELRPSRHCRSTGDNAAWNVVFDASTGDRFKGNMVALFGTNYRTATLQFNSVDAWGAPPSQTTIDSTVATFTVGAGNRGAGYVGPASNPNWRPGQFKTDGDAHRWFLECSLGVYEIADNSEDQLFVSTTNLVAATGTAYIFCDRMAAILTRFEQWRYMRLLVGAQQTADNYYRTGTPIFDKFFLPWKRYDNGFVDRIEPNVEVFESDSGYRAATRLGPRRMTLAVQWPPLNRLGTDADLERRIADLYAALEGEKTPVVFWRDPPKPDTLMLATLAGTYAVTNVKGEGDDAVSRIDQLILEEVW
jgi:hypothetical protein